MCFLLDKTNNGAANNNGAAEARSRLLKKEKQTIEKGSRRLTVRRKKKFDPTFSKCYNCMFCTTLRNNKMKKPSGKNYLKKLKESMKLWNKCHYEVNHKTIHGYSNNFFFNTLFNFLHLCVFRFLV
jgi:hypothetical protein